MKSNLRAEIVICSRAIVRGEKRNNVGELIQKEMATHGIQVAGMKFIEDSPQVISDTLRSVDADLVIFSGGTSEKSKFVVVETLTPMLEARYSDLEDKIKAFGEERSQLAKRSSPMVGKIGKLIIIAIPGSTNGARDALEVIFPYILNHF